MATASTGSQPNAMAGTNPTPMSVDEGFFTQPVQAYFQFVQSNVTYINEGNIDAVRRGRREAHTAHGTNSPATVSRVCLSEIAHQRAEAERRHEHLTSEHAVSRTAAEQEVAKLRQELSDANAKLKNVANAVAPEAEQRASQKVAQVTARYEQRYSEQR